MAQAIRSPRFRGGQVAEGRHITRSDLFPHPRHFRGRHHAATIFVVVLLAVVGFRVFPTSEVTVISNGQAFQVSATFDPGSEGLAAASLQLQQGDRVVLATGGRHASVAVDRANPVSIAIDGHTVAVRTQASTVGGALASAGIELRPGDQVYLEGRLTTARAPLASAAVAARTGLRSPDEPVNLSVVRARPVTVMVDTLRVETSSAATTVGELLADLGMIVREGDLVRPALDTPIGAGVTVRLAKARTINIVLDGKEQSLYTLALTVDDVLDVLGVEVGPDDVLSLPRETFVTNGMSLVVGTTRVVEEEVATTISPATFYETDGSLPPGQVKIIPGREGVRVTRFSVTLKNGVETDRVAVATETRQDPVPTRHISGPPASSAKPASGTLDTPEYKGPFTKKMTVVATWYNASHGGREPGDPAYGLTATGIPLARGLCAVDPAVIPLHTRFFVPGYGFCVAADTGGAIKGNIIDLGFPEEDGDPGWGRRTVDIYVID